MEMVPLDYVTWRLYLQFDLDQGDPNIPDQLVSVLGQNGIETSIEIDPLFFNFDCRFYQHPSGEILGTNINTIFTEFSPSLKYDSWVTIGAENDAVPAGDLLTVGDIWPEVFENEGELIIGGQFGGGWFCFPPSPIDSPNGSTDENDRVLIAQFTIPYGCELENAQLCFQYWVDGLQERNTISCVTETEPNKCLTYPIFPENN